MEQCSHRRLFTAMDGRPMSHHGVMNACSTSDKYRNNIVINGQNATELRFILSNLKILSFKGKKGYAVT
jgi:hypothetical protein